MSKIILSSLAMLAFSGVGLMAADGEAMKAKPYPLTTCIVTGDKLEADETIVKVYDGQEVKFCCKSCIAKFEKKPAEYLKKIQDAAAAKPAEMDHSKMHM